MISLLQVEAPFLRSSLHPRWRSSCMYRVSRPKDAAQPLFRLVDTLHVILSMHTWCVVFMGTYILLLIFDEVTTTLWATTFNLRYCSLECGMSSLSPINASFNSPSFRAFVGQSMYVAFVKSRVRMFIVYTLRTEPWSDSSTSFSPTIQTPQLSDACNRRSRLSPANGGDKLFTPKITLTDIGLAFTLAEYGSVCTFTISGSNAYQLFGVVGPKYRFLVVIAVCIAAGYSNERS